MNEYGNRIKNIYICRHFDYASQFSSKKSIVNFKTRISAFQTQKIKFIIIDSVGSFLTELKENILN